MPFRSDLVFGFHEGLFDLLKLAGYERRSMRFIDAWRFGPDWPRYHDGPSHQLEKAVPMSSL